MPGSKHKPLRIDYVSEGFPSGSRVANGPGTLSTCWDDILWAAVTVGRPNRQYVFHHGMSSFYEALFRLSAVRMSVEQRGATGSRLWRTDAAKTLDPSEKGAVSYFLGLTLCKLFASALLRTHWLLHLDTFRPMLNPILRGRSRPDLVGETSSRGWIAMEAKGRVSQPDSAARRRAKDQALRLVRVNGQAPQSHIGGISYFRGDVLQFFWRDPEQSEQGRSFEVELSPDSWRSYYAAALAVVGRPEGPDAKSTNQLVAVEGADVEVGIHPVVLRRLRAEDWEGARLECIERAAELQEQEYQPDGIRVVAGNSWRERTSEI